MDKRMPTIKGVFVLSQVNSVRRAKGEAGLAELSRRYGKPINFGTTEDVPVEEEVRLIAHALQIINDDKIPADKIDFESGRLHFRNFIATPLAKLILGTITDLKYLFLHSKYIAEHVFRGIIFTSEDLGGERIKITMKGGVYPLDHFTGLWWEWGDYFGFKPKIEARMLGDEEYEYIIDLSEKKTEKNR